MYLCIVTCIYRQKQGGGLMNSFDELVSAINDIDTYEDTYKIMDELLTDKERYDLALRWKILKQLNEGKTQRDISSNLGVSLCKVTRGARVLKRKECVSKRILESSKKSAKLDYSY